MPKVSVLIPAFRPQYLDLAIASALSQTFTDFELLISDDSSDELVASVVSKWRDPRIRYSRNPQRQIPGANRDRLLGMAQGKYIKFLFDDDFLLPQSIDALVWAAEQTGAPLVFHGRHVVDARGCVLMSPLVVAEGQFATLDRRAFFNATMGSSDNPIGEPSNILLEADTFRSLDRPFAVAGFAMRFLTDVALYVNFFVNNSKVVAVGMMGSAFRKHTEQCSNTRFPAYSAGLFEWELLLRWAIDRAEVDPACYDTAIARLHESYRPHVQLFPELGPFLELAGKRGPEGYFSDQFQELARLAYAAIEMRRVANAQAGSPQPGAPQSAPAR